MKKIFSFLLLICFWFNTNAQYNFGYGNSWVDHDKTYYKFISNETGLHRINYSTLAQLGISLNGSAFKLYHKGEEIPIFVTNSGNFGTTDYIEFYGSENDGYFDTQLFTSPNDHIHQYKSFFTKGSAYFLTSSPETSNKRYIQATNNLAGAPPKKDYFMYESVKVKSTQFNPGEAHKDGSGIKSFYGFYEEGEGKVSTEMNSGTLVTTHNVTTEYLYSAAPVSADVEVRVVGKGESQIAIDNHHFHISVNGNKYLSYASMFRWDLETFNFNLPLSQISNSTTFKFEPYDSVVVVGGGAATFDLETKIALSYIKVNYPRQFNFDNETDFKFELDIDTDTYIEISNFNGGSNPVIYDLTAGRRINPIFEDGVYKVRITPIGGVDSERTFYITSTTNSNNLTNLSEYKEVNFTDYNDPANQGDYIIISHPSLREGNTDWVSEYADYRENESPCTKYDVVEVNIEELYEQFAHGIRKHPLSIRNFINYAMDFWEEEPEYLLLLGKSIEYSTLSESTSATLNNFEECLVPTYGHQPSDLLLTCRNNFDYRPQLALGRIPAKNPAEVKAYLDKLKEYESYFVTDCSDLSDREWMSRVLHIANGFNGVELETYLEYLDEYAISQESAPASLEVVNTLTSSSYTVNFPQIDAYMEDGLGIITYFGHSGAQQENYWEINDIKDPDNPNFYENEGMYPLIFSNSCFVGQIHRDDSESQAEEWVLEDDAGAIGLLATIALSFPTYLDIFTNELNNNLFNEHYGEPVGFNLKQTIEDIYAPFGSPAYEGTVVTCLEFTWTGDPAVRPYLFDNPEYLISDIDTDPPFNQGPILLTEDGEIEVEVTLENLGKVDGLVNIEIVRVYEDGSQEVVISEDVISPNRLASYIFNIPANPADGVGTNQLIVTVNGDETILEDCFNNNEAILEFIGEPEDPIICPEVNIDIIGLDADTYCAEDTDIELEADVNVSNGTGTFEIDGQSINNDNFNPSDYAPGQYIITYDYVFNNNEGQQCSEFSSTTINIVEIPNATFSVDLDPGSTLCIDEPITFTYEGGSDTDFDWSFGDNASTSSASTEGPHFISYTEGGMKTITLSVENSAGCKEEMSVNIEVLSKLEDPQINCVNQTESSVEFQWNAVDGAEYYAVSFDGGVLEVNETSFMVDELDIEEEVFISVTAIGVEACANSEIVPAFCSSNFACSSTETEILNINETYCYGESAVLLEATPIGGQFTVNGETNDTFDPSILDPGDYNIQYVYIDENDCTFADQVNVTINEPGDVSIDGDATSICLGETVTLTANAALDGQFFWDGSGIIENNNESITVSPQSNEEYILTYVDASGCIYNGVAAVEINEDNNPNASFQTSAAGICIGESITLTNNSTNANNISWEITDPNGEITSSQDDEIDLTLNEVGEYGVSITVQGCGVTEDTFTQTSAFTVSGLPEVGVPNDFTVCPNEEFILEVTGVSSVVVASEALTPTGGTTFSGILDHPETFEIIGSNEFGCSNSATLTVSVNPDVTITLSEDVTICPGDEVTLNAQGGATYEWVVDDEVVETESEITLPIGEMTTFNVTAISEFSCTKTASVTVDVDEELCDVELKVPNAFTPNGDGTNDAFVIENLDRYPQATIEIYNRWGQIVYEAAPYGNDWNGTNDGEDLPHATYYYILELNDGSPVQTGTITILK